MQYAIDRFAAGAGLETPKTTSSHARLTGLDGLRAVAVLAVMLFHADLSFARGGYLGVDLFFVISGFLITGLLAGESSATGRLDLKAFYWRRAKRLLPASWTMTVVAIIAAAAFAPDALPRLRWDALASLFYVTNWELIGAGKSYFDFIGRQPLLLHLWSLAIEEQFYLLWAPVLLFCLPRFRPQTIAGGALVAAAAGAGWMALSAARMGYPETGDPTRLYFGTDTHGFGLLIGAALGLLWQPARIKTRLSLPDQEGVFIAGGLALIASLASFYFLDEAKTWLYPWGFLLSAAISAGLIVAATHPGAGFGRFLDNAPMRWIGERSYGLYLWHWPIYMLTRPGLDLDWSSENVLALRLGLTFLISGLSYLFIEMPIRQGALERLYKTWREGSAFNWRPVAGGMAALAAGVAAVLVLAMAKSDVAPPADVVQALAADTAAKPVPIQTMTASAAAAAPEMVSGDVTAVGDSVLLGSSGVLTATIPGAKVYAHMGWQASNVLDQLRQLHDAGQITPIVIIHLGTNGFVLESQLRQMLELVKDAKRVVLVNTHVPRRWMDLNNEMMARVVSAYPNAVLADWAATSDQQADFFISDGIHLTGPGKRAFISAIIRAGHIALPETRSAHAVDPNARYAYAPGDLSKTLVRYAHPQPLDAFWSKVAWCASRGAWNGRKAGGGLGISAANWAAYGGLAFAPVPNRATAEQQIEIANRISTQGWTLADGTAVAAAGFASFPCAGHKPELLNFTPQSVLAQSFHWLERGQVVRDLQLVLGLPRDGIYSRHTAQRHLALLQERGLPTDLAAPTE
ncbi:MAG: acyltransferase family protein [Proteobacteria bacterium]|nr:acyltransferase family protein [Pseudomonadota bacterium]